MSEGIAAVPYHRHDGDGPMNVAMAIPGNASTFLTHFFGRGLADERYVVERFRAMADGDIRRWPGDATAKRRRGAKRVTATVTAVRELRPARNEIIVCTALNLKASGVQYWGDIATGMFHDRRQKG